MLFEKYNKQSEFRSINPPLLSSAIEMKSLKQFRRLHYLSGFNGLFKFMSLFSLSENL